MKHLRQAILDAAIAVARKRGFHGITQAEVAKLAHSAEGTIHYHFGSMAGLRTAVMNYAIEHRELRIVAAGLVCNHPSLRVASADLKRDAAKCLA